MRDPRTIRKEIKVFVLHSFNLYGNPSEVWARRVLRSIEEQGIEQATVSALGWPGFKHTDSWDFRAFSQRGTGWIGSLKHQLAYYRYPNWLDSQIEIRSEMLVHAHFATAGWRAFPFCVKNNLPLVVSFYGMDYESIPYRKPVWKKRYGELFEYASVVVAEGPHGAATLQKMACPAEKVQLIPIGVESGKYEKKVRKKTEGMLRLVQLASFVEKKGQENSIRAFALALKQCPNMRLTLAGDGSTGRLRQLVSDLGISDRVHFRGFVAYETLEEFLGGFDVFIHPSQYGKDRDCEGGAPTIVLEAQAMGMPIIATTHCDLPFVVREKKSGLLTPEGDVEALANSICEFYKMGDAEFSTYSRNARLLMEEAFLPSETGKKLKSVYQSILNPS